MKQHEERRERGAGQQAEPRGGTTTGARESVERTRERPVFMPRTDIYETENSVVLVAEMPGVDENSVDITLEDNVLTITGRTRELDVPDGYRRVYSEFGAGDYQRSFALSNKADANGIKASTKHGLLRVEVPKAKPAQKKIPVMAE